MNPTSPARDEAAQRQALFAPRSIAVIGASTDETKIGGLPIAYLKAHGFDGTVYPINPRASTVQGLRAWADVREVDGEIDLAICAVPGSLAKDAVSACAEKGVHGMIMFTAGFAEVSPQGAAAQAELSAIARAAGMRLAGPNCMGMANLRTGAIASFHGAFSEPVARDGRIGLVSQSGAFGGLSALMARQRGLPFGHVITTGNEADVEAADGLLFLADQPHVDVILLYVEGVRDGARFLRGLKLAHERGKAVIAIKLGSTEVGGAAAASHTAALAGADEVYDAVFRQYGVHRARSIEEFLDLGCTVAIGGLPSDDNAGIVTVSGGVGVLMADDASSRGLRLPELSARTQAAVKALVPFAGTRNPLDITGQVVNDRALLNKAVDLLLDDEARLATVITFQGAALVRDDALETLVEPWIEIVRRHPDRWFALAGMVPSEIRRVLDRAGIPAFVEPTHATRAAAVLAGISAHLRRDLNLPEVGDVPALPVGKANEADSLAVLRSAGLDTVDTRVAADADAAAAAAETIGFPVVLKLLSPDVVHKSDIGGVCLNLREAGEVRDAFARIMRSVASAAPEARIDGVLVAPMITDGVETIVGVTRDPVFGPVVMFGIGGVHVEVLGDVSFRVAPFSVDEAERMIDEIRGHKLLAGVRGRPAVDRTALARALSRLSIFAAAHADSLVSLEANPFVVREQGALALDAVLLTD
ncbi:MAG: acetate--CoA ligase family protein [Burkholderiaceae bacterium]